MAQILGIDNVTEIYSTDSTDKIGAWRILFKTPITDSNLSDLDKIIATAPSSDLFITPAHRIRKQTERFTSAARDYWKNTIKDKGWQKKAPIPT